MHTIFLILGFSGAWLLFAGSIYQAYLELTSEQLQADHIRATLKNVGPPSKASAWWWLLPPVKIILERQLGRAYREQFIRTMDPGDVSLMLDFGNKAAGWLLVAGGGALIAMKETYELAERFAVPAYGYIPVIAGLLFLSIRYAFVRSRRDKALKGKRQYPGA